jgi:pantothenate kinase-related protein Tda10
MENWKERVKEIGIKIRSRYVLENKMIKKESEQWSLYQMASPLLKTKGKGWSHEFSLLQMS